MFTDAKLIIFILVLFQLGCTDEKIERYDISPILKAKAELATKPATLVKLELCDIDLFNWNRIIIIPPYTTVTKIKSYKLDNSSFVEKHLLDTLYRETDCLLLFVQNNNVVRYSYVSREFIDFNYINNTNTNRTLSKEIACERLYIKNINSTLKLYY
ncbi:MAG: hypothetical protein ACQUHE_12715 [Bacteroidia bacterium]